MVSAVFHSPWGSSAKAETSLFKTQDKIQNAIVLVANKPIDSTALMRETSKKKIKKVRRQVDWQVLAQSVWPPIFGLTLLVGIWALVSITSGSSIPSPFETFKQALVVFSDPFYRKGPNDQGIGWNILMSLERVALGFGLAALVGIPAGFMIGRFKVLSSMFYPLISLLRPVSPLAWLPIGLLVFKGASPAAIWTIFICSI